MGRDVRIHAGDSGVTAKKKGRYSEYGTAASRLPLEAKSAGKAEEKLGDADAAGTRGEKMSALMDKDEHGKGDQAPEYR